MEEELDVKMEKEEFFGVLLNSTKEQQQVIYEALKKFEQQNTRLDLSISLLKKTVQDSIADYLTDTTKAEINGKINPLLERLTRELEKTTDRATEEKKQLTRAQALLSWKWVLLASLASASIAAVLVFGVYSAVWWQRHELESLTTDVAEMAQNVARLEKLNGRIHLEMCGEHEDQPCVEVDTKHAYGKDADSRYKFFRLRIR